MIKGFKISINGENSFLTIKTNSNYLTLFYMNKINNNEKVYEYYIYIPECNDNNYELYNSLNENKSDGQKEKLSNLFTVKTNKYYFEITNNPDEYGYFKLNNNKITERVLIDNNDYILDFIVTKNDISTDKTIIINYFVSVEDEEAYSKECQITLTIKCSNNCNVGGGNGGVGGGGIVNGGGNNNNNNKQNGLETLQSGVSLTQMKSIISRDISSYVNPSEPINGENFKALILSSDDMNPETQLQNGISAVDLGNCINIIKGHNNIQNNQNLIIMNIESNNNGKTHTQIEVYDFSGNKLDISVCKEEIKVMKFIGNYEGIDINTAKLYSDQGIDVFDASDNFFNDICHPYNSPNNRDIFIKILHFVKMDADMVE